MQYTTAILPSLINALVEVIEKNAEEVTGLDQQLGDGDHVINLQRGLDALLPIQEELTQLDWSKALKKIGMTLLSTMGGASGSLFGTLLIRMSQAVNDNSAINSTDLAEIFYQGVEAVKKRGKSEAGEKTMLDVLIPVAEALKQSVQNKVEFSLLLQTVSQTANEGMESTRDMLATKGRASYLQEKSLGHIDAGARTSQLMICAMVDVFAKNK